MSSMDKIDISPGDIIIGLMSLYTHYGPGAPCTRLFCERRLYQPFLLVARLRVEGGHAFHVLNEDGLSWAVWMTTDGNLDNCPYRRVSERHV
jgi:hypothetical protein